MFTGLPTFPQQVPHHSTADDKIAELLDKPQRVHDVVDITAQGSGQAAGAARRLLLRGTSVMRHVAHSVLLPDGDG